MEKVGKPEYGNSMIQVSRHMQVESADPVHASRPQVSRKMKVGHSYPLSHLSVHHLLGGYKKISDKNINE